MSTLARNTDPVTSHEAIADFAASGKRKTHNEIVMRVVDVWPGSTAAEIGSISGLGHVAAQRRLSDLMRAGKVYQGEARLSTGSTRRMVEWHPVVVVPEQGTLWR